MSLQENQVLNDVLNKNTNSDQNSRTDSFKPQQQSTEYSNNDIHPSSKKDAMHLNLKENISSKFSALLRHCEEAMKQVEKDQENCKNNPDSTSLRSLSTSRDRLFHTFKQFEEHMKRMFQTVDQQLPPDYRLHQDSPLPSPNHNEQSTLKEPHLDHEQTLESQQLNHNMSSPTGTEGSFNNLFKKKNKERMPGAFDFYSSGEEEDNNIPEQQGQDIKDFSPRDSFHTQPSLSLKDNEPIGLNNEGSTFSSPVPQSHLKPGLTNEEDFTLPSTSNNSNLLTSLRNVGQNDEICKKDNDDITKNEKDDHLNKNSDHFVGYYGGLQPLDENDARLATSVHATEGAWVKPTTTLNASNNNTNHEYQDHHNQAQRNSSHSSHSLNPTLNPGFLEETPNQNASTLCLPPEADLAPTSKSQSAVSDNPSNREHSNSSAKDIMHNYIQRNSTSETPSSIGANAGATVASFIPNSAQYMNHSHDNPHSPSSLDATSSDLIDNDKVVPAKNEKRNSLISFPGASVMAAGLSVAAEKLGLRQTTSNDAAHNKHDVDNSENSPIVSEIRHTNQDPAIANPVSELPHQAEPKILNEFNHPNAPASEKQDDAAAIIKEIRNADSADPKANYYKEIFQGGLGGDSTEPIIKNAQDAELDPADQPSFADQERLRQEAIRNRNLRNQSALRRESFEGGLGGDSTEPIIKNAQDAELDPADQPSFADQERLRQEAIRNRNLRNQSALRRESFEGGLGGDSTEPIIKNAQDAELDPADQPSFADQERLRQEAIRNRNLRNQSALRRESFEGGLGGDSTEPIIKNAQDAELDPADQPSFADQERLRQEAIRNRNLRNQSALRRESFEGGLGGDSTEPIIKNAQDAELDPADQPSFADQERLRQEAIKNRDLRNQSALRRESFQGGLGGDSTEPIIKNAQDTELDPADQPSFADQERLRQEAIRNRDLRNQSALRRESFQGGLGGDSTEPIIKNAQDTELDPADQPSFADQERLRQEAIRNRDLRNQSALRRESFQGGLGGDSTEPIIKNAQDAELDPADQPSFADQESRRRNNAVPDEIAENWSDQLKKNIAEAPRFKDDNDKVSNPYEQTPKASNTTPGFVSTLAGLGAMMGVSNAPMNISPETNNDEDDSKLKDMKDDTSDTIDNSTFTETIFKGIDGAKSAVTGAVHSVVSPIMNAMEYHSNENDSTPSELMPSRSTTNGAFTSPVNTADTPSLAIGNNKLNNDKDMTPTEQPTILDKLTDQGLSLLRPSEKQVTAGQLKEVADHVAKTKNEPVGGFNNDEVISTPALADIAKRIDEDQFNMHDNDVDSSKDNSSSKNDVVVMVNHLTSLPEAIGNNVMIETANNNDLPVTIPEVNPADISKDQNSTEGLNIPIMVKRRSTQGTPMSENSSILSDKSGAISPPPSANNNSTTFSMPEPIDKIDDKLNDYKHEHSNHTMNNMEKEVPRTNHTNVFNSAVPTHSNNNGSNDTNEGDSTRNVLSSSRSMPIPQLFNPNQTGSQLTSNADNLKSSKSDTDTHINYSNSAGSLPIATSKLPLGLDSLKTSPSGKLNLTHCSPNFNTDSIPYVNYSDSVPEIPLTESSPQTSQNNQDDINIVKAPKFDPSLPKFQNSEDFSRDSSFNSLDAHPVTTVVKNLGSDLHDVDDYNKMSSMNNTLNQSDIDIPNTPHYNYSKPFDDTSNLPEKLNTPKNQNELVQNVENIDNEEPVSPSKKKSHDSTLAIDNSGNSIPLDFNHHLYSDNVCASQQNNDIFEPSQQFTPSALDTPNLFSKKVVDPMTDSDTNRLNNHNGQVVEAADNIFTPMDKSSALHNSESAQKSAGENRPKQDNNMPSNISPENISSSSFITLTSPLSASAAPSPTDMGDKNTRLEGNTHSVIASNIDEQRSTAQPFSGETTDMKHLANEDSFSPRYNASMKQKLDSDDNSLQNSNIIAPAVTNLSKERNNTHVDTAVMKQLDTDMSNRSPNYSEEKRKLSSSLDFCHPSRDVNKTTSNVIPSYQQGSAVNNNNNSKGSYSNYDIPSAEFNETPNMMLDNSEMGARARLDKLDSLESDIEKQLDSMSPTSNNAQHQEAPPQIPEHEKSPNHHSSPVGLHSTSFYDVAAADALKRIYDRMTIPLKTGDKSDRVLKVREGFENFTGFGVKCVSDVISPNENNKTSNI
ncbi:uncharacterized protein BX663DRAFT_563671 [Cokeromyces recurvatus]|uniref:uncharacterized protein n=1 Tax=Cokeromyces recurvatus TaxID=90255 RepID=UPI00221EF3E4|nr:uncharacterized protein BX663DRAFT_563671 [Cokeromyces recurvatus]KAI7899720.1 hypothetical protein BX663DRAFT_563671 [Cokeromyces recurvatus]